MIKNIRYVCCLFLSIWILPTIAHAVSLQFPNPSTENFYAQGFVELDRGHEKANLAGRFAIGKKNDKLVYMKFDPASTCTTVLQPDEVLRASNYAAYIMGRNQNNPSADLFAYVRRTDQPVVYYCSLSSFTFDKDCIAYIRMLSTIATSGTLTHVEGAHYRNHCLKGEVPNERLIDFLVDDKGRVTSASVAFRYASNDPPAPTFLLLMTYRGDGVFPYTISVRNAVNHPSIFQGPRFWQFDEVIQDAPIDAKIRPTLLTEGTKVQDVRFTPPLNYTSTGTSFPSDEELFRIAEVKKAEKEAQAKLAAAAKDPRNIPPSAPVVKESYLKYLRQIPNWVYVSLLGVAIIGWVLARASRRKE